LPAPAPTCPLCRSRPADTVEHVIPQRVVRDVFGPGPHIIRRRRGPMVIDGNVRPQAVKLSICSDCNNTFLNQQFEQPLAWDVVSLARGQKVLLEPKDSSAIGRYLFKTHLVMELAKRPSRVDPADVAHFWTTAEPPSGWSVWAFRAQRSPLREHGVDPGSICLRRGLAFSGSGRGALQLKTWSARSAGSSPTRRQASSTLSFMSTTRRVTSLGSGPCGHPTSTGRRRCYGQVGTDASFSRSTQSTSANPLLIRGGETGGWSGTAWTRIP